MKKILCVVLCAAMLCSVAALFAGCGKADAGEVNVYNWGEYIAEGQDGLMNVTTPPSRQTRTSTTCSKTATSAMTSSFRRTT